MSWDLDVGACLCCGRCREGFNYTHNTNPMMRAAGAGPEDFHGLGTVEAKEKMTKLIAALESNPEKYRAMNPENGWGSYETLLPVLRRISAALDQCSSDEKVTVSM